MTVQAMNEFTARLDGDKALAARLGERLGKVSDDGQMSVTTAAFARECGFDVTEEDVTQQVAAVRAGKAGELSDGELEAVAGGVWGLWSNVRFGSK